METTDISKIRPYPRNAKEHKDRQIKKIADSIREFGFNQPLVLDKEGVIIVGHGRYFAARQLGMDTVPTLTLDLDEEKANAYRLADNKLNESEWDMEIVIDELKKLSLEMIDLTGFNSNLILETQEDMPDLSSIGAPRSVLGDLYELGEHRLICGDSTQPDAYLKLLGDEKARMIFTDPPYSVDYQSSAGISYHSEKFGGTGGRIFNDNKTPAEAVGFYKDVLTRLHEYSTDDVTLYWWFANNLSDVNLRAWRDTLWHESQICIWIKNQFVFSLGQLYHRTYEPCMVGWKEGKSHYIDGTFANISDIWMLDSKKFSDYLDAWYAKRDPTSKYIHPTQKPVRLAEAPIKRSSQRDDIVLDAFGGSGSTLIACEQLNRKARLKEDPKVVKNGEEIQWAV